MPAPASKPCPVWFVTGTATEVGKTVFATALTAYLASAIPDLAVFKPIASGSRSDARRLRIANRGRQSLDGINPWHFRQAIAPAAAAELAGRTLTLKQVCGHVSRARETSQLVLVEGAGGLLSPLGSNFDSRSLIQAWGATAFVVSTTRLGAINQLRLTLEALPNKKTGPQKACVVLMLPPRPNLVSRSVLKWVNQFLPKGQVLLFPHLKAPEDSLRSIQLAEVQAALGGCDQIRMAMRQ